MRKSLIALLLAAVCLTGCSQPVPRQAADGTAWNPKWVSVGNVVGVDTPEGITFREYNDALTANGMYYADWSIGEAEPYTNADGDEAQIYDAQICLLLAGYSEAGKAADSASQWLDMAAGRYAVESTSPETHNGQAFTVITHTYPSETNPYASGASAFGVYRNYALSVEVSCRDGFQGSAGDILTEFLEHCHYAA